MIFFYRRTILKFSALSINCISKLFFPLILRLTTRFYLLRYLKNIISVINNISKY